MSCDGAVAKNMNIDSHAGTGVAVTEKLATRLNEVIVWSGPSKRFYCRSFA